MKEISTEKPHLPTNLKPFIDIRIMKTEQATKAELIAPEHHIGFQVLDVAEEQPFLTIGAEDIRLPHGFKAVQLTIDYTKPEPSDTLGFYLKLYQR